MNATQAGNLRTLISHMETNCHRILNMREVETPCGSPACALGEAKYVCEGLRDQFTYDTYSCAERLFGLRSPVEIEQYQEPWSIYRLFGVRLNGKDEVTPQEWAVEARKVLAENGYAMDEAKPIPSVRERLDAIYEADADLILGPEQAERYAERV